MEEERKIRQINLDQAGNNMSYRHLHVSTSSESATESVKTPDKINNEWKAVRYFLLGQKYVDVWLLNIPNHSL